MEPYDNQEIINSVIDKIQDQLTKVAREKFEAEFGRKPNDDEEKHLLFTIEERVDGILEDIDAAIVDAENELELDVEEMAFAAELDEADDDLFVDDDTFGLKTETKETKVEIDDDGSETSWDDA